MTYYRIIPQHGVPFSTKLATLPGEVVELDKENITNEELVDIVNWRFKPERSPLFSAVFGDPDFLPFAILEQGVMYGKAVGRLLLNLSEDEKTQELIDNIHKYERNSNKIFNIDELSEILSIEKPDVVEAIFDSSLERPSDSLTVDKVNSLMPIPVGTGFLVGRNYLLTNNHVLPTEADANNMIVEFGYDKDILGRCITPFQCKLDSSFFQTSEKLDYTLVRIKQDNSLEGSEIGDYFGWIPMIENPRIIAPSLGVKKAQEIKLDSKILPEVQESLEKRLQRLVNLTQNNLGLPENNLGLPGEPVTIIQHPKGKYKQIVLFNNRVQKITNNFIYYEADSNFGSSGSPVFNQKWQLVALHRAVITLDGKSIESGIVGYEGVRICRIVNDLIDKLKYPTLSTHTGLNSALNSSEIKNFISNYIFLTEETKSKLNKDDTMLPEKPYGMSSFIRPNNFYTSF